LIKNGAIDRAIERLSSPFDNESPAEMLDRKRWLSSIKPVKQIVGNTVKVEITKDSSGNIDVVVSAGLKSMNE
jgi:hypothetical protein